MTVKPAEKEVVKISIMDKDYHVACEASLQSGLVNAARHLDQKMREIRRAGRVVGTDRIAVMAALNMAYELQDQKRAQVENFPDVQTQKQINTALEQVNSVLIDEAKKA